MPTFYASFHPAHLNLPQHLLPQSKSSPFSPFLPDQATRPADSRLKLTSVSSFFLYSSLPTSIHPQSRTQYGYYLQPDSLQPSNRSGRPCLQGLQGGRSDSARKGYQPGLLSSLSFMDSIPLLTHLCCSFRTYSLCWLSDLTPSLFFLSSFYAWQASTTRRKRFTSSKSPSQLLVLDKSSFEYELRGSVGVIVSSLLDLSSLRPSRSRWMVQRDERPDDSKVRSSSQISFLLLPLPFLFPSHVRQTRRSLLEARSNRRNYDCDR